MNPVILPDGCSDAEHAELLKSKTGEPFLVLLCPEGFEHTTLKFEPLFSFAASQPDLRTLMEKALHG